MIVVSDTSPVSTLLKIDKVDLLHKLYGAVLIPEAVRKELSLRHASLPAFFECVAVSNLEAVRKLQAELDLGEAEAIVLFGEKHAELLLIDEIDGRKVAAREGIPYIGLLGILDQAKIAGFIPSVREVLNQIETKTTFFLSEELKIVALKKAGEL